MAEITFTAAQIAPVFPDKAVIRSYIATETITKGQPVYILTTGKVGVMDTNTGGKEQFRGVALNGGGAGQAIDVLQDGECYGFDVSAKNADTWVYGGTAKYDDATVTKEVHCGRIVCLSDKDLTKVVRIFVQWEANW